VFVVLTSYLKKEGLYLDYN